MPILAALNTPRRPWGSYMVNTAACCQSTTLSPEGPAPALTVSSSLYWTFLPLMISFWNSTWPCSPFFPSTEGKHSLWRSKQKACDCTRSVLHLYHDWCKHSLSFTYRSAMIGADTLATPSFWLYKQALWLMWAGWETPSCATPWCCNIKPNKGFFQVVFSCIFWSLSLVKQVELGTVKVAAEQQQWQSDKRIAKGFQRVARAEKKGAGQRWWRQKGQWRTKDEKLQTLVTGGVIWSCQALRVKNLRYLGPESNTSWC
jgi:hypothetical protein